MPSPLSIPATWRQSSPGRTYWLATLALIGGGIGIGFVPIFVRLSDVGPIAVAFWRFALATPLLYLWQRLDGPRDKNKPAAATFSPWLLIPGLFFTGDLTFFHLSIHYTAVADATLFTNMAPIFVTFISWRFFGEHFRPLFVVGLALAIAGAAMMVRASSALGSSHLLGDGLGLLSPMFYAGYLLTVRRLRQTYSSSTIMLYAAVVATCALLVLTLLSGEVVLSNSWQGWLLLLALAWFSHVGGQGLITYALAHLPAHLASVILLMQPVAAAVFAWLLLHEGMNPLQMFGGVLVLAGIFLAQRHG